MLGFRRAVIGAASGLVVVLLAGCAGGGSGQPGDAASSAGQVIAVTPLGTATFAENSAGVSGTVELIADLNGDLMLVLNEAHIPQSDAMLSLSYFPMTQACPVDGRSLDLPELKSTVSVGSLADDFAGDPRLFRTIVLAAQAGDSSDGTCAWTVLAQAPIIWSGGRPSTLIAVDSGARTGATGEVTPVDQQPAAYTIAAGDNASAIAARFGIAREQLEFLNPFVYLDDYLQPGHILVLTPAWRGLNANQSNQANTPGWIATP